MSGSEGNLLSKWSTILSEGKELGPLGKSETASMNDLKPRLGKYQNLFLYKVRN